MTDQDSAEKILTDSWSENDCGDMSCKERRLVAALHVLRGGTSHTQYAQSVEDAVALAPEQAADRDIGSHA